ncbi:MAG: vWA domain-containing protein [Flavobacteriaceae bacterium]
MFNTNFEFASPLFLWLLIFVPLLGLWYFFTRKRNVAKLSVPSTAGFNSGNWLGKSKIVLTLIRLAAITLVILALARPQIVEVSTQTKSNKGIDIVMAIDASASMLSKDLEPNRLEALKRVAIQFVNERPSDRFGVVVYAGESFTKTPITSDKRIVNRSIDEIQWGKLEGGTAIGMGLGSAVNRLKDSKALSKVIILLTDGENNAGNIDPKLATELAREFGIKVYTIGLGTKGKALSPYRLDVNGNLIYDMIDVNIDEELLQYIADQTGGLYFRATDNLELAEIYTEINKLEKTEIEEFKYYNYQELYRPWILWALALLGLEYILRHTVYRSFI